MNPYLTGALLLAASTTALAQNYQKNNLPCIQEFCLGDGLPELSKVPWDRAKRQSPMGNPEYAGTLPIPAGEKKRIDAGFHGAVASAAPYLYIEAFDRKALPLLAKITSACQRSELIGTFKTESGNPTRVKIALIPDKTDPSAQRWTVVSISRDFLEAKSATQQAEIRKQLDARYGRFSFSKGIQKGVDAMYTIHHDPVMTGRYGFSLSLSSDIKDQERYRQHPTCGGGKRLSID